MRKSRIPVTRPRSRRAYGYWLHVLDTPYPITSANHIDHDRLLIRCRVLQNRKLGGIFSYEAVDECLQLERHTGQCSTKCVENALITRLRIAGKAAQRSRRIIGDQSIDHALVYVHNFEPELHWEI